MAADFFSNLMMAAVFGCFKTATVQLYLKCTARVYSCALEKENIFFLVFLSATLLIRHEKEKESN